MQRKRVYKQYGPEGLKSLFTSEKIRGVENPYFLDNAYLSSLPTGSRKYAVMELLDALKSNLAKKKKNPKHRFELKHRVRKGAQSFRIEFGAVRRLGNGRVRIYPGSKLLSKGGFEANEKNVVDFESDLILQKDVLGRYWLIAPYYVVPDNQGSFGERGCCAIDPGVRTFATVYDPEHGLHKIGDGASSRIFGLLKNLDALLAKQAEWDERVGRSKKRVACSRSRRRLALAIQRLRERVKDLVRELHRKTAHFLTTRYHTIVLPPFETKKMSSKICRKLRKKSVRQMLGMSHYAFRLKLQAKAEQRGCTVHILGEEYTSKTCTSCGNIHEKLGSSERFVCPTCAVVYDRDGGAARNIFIKNYEITTLPR